MRIERPGRPYTLAEVDAADDAGSEWWEADRGALVVYAPPSFAHQSMVAGLMRAWLSALDPDDWRVLTGPQRVVLDDTTWAEPDLAIWPVRDSQIPPSAVPALVAAVISPSTATRDRTLKPGLYAAAGVRWLVLADPEDLTVATFHLTRPGGVDPLSHTIGDGAVTCPLTWTPLVPSRLTRG